MSRRRTRSRIALAAITLGSGLLALALLNACIGSV
jgi:hypothetical protein